MNNSAHSQYLLFLEYNFYTIVILQYFWTIQKQNKEVVEKRIFF